MNISTFIKGIDAKSHPQGYELLDSGNFQKLERVGRYTLIRPALGAAWAPRASQNIWKNADACFERTSAKGGRWIKRQHNKRTKFPQEINQENLNRCKRLHSVEIPC